MPWSYTEAYGTVIMQVLVCSLRLYFSDDLFDRSQTVLCLHDRASDDDIIRAVGQRPAKSCYTLLVVVGCTNPTNSGGYDHKIRFSHSFSDCRNLLRRRY